MRLLVIDENYPNELNLYGDVFAHTRVKSYQASFTDILVATNSAATKKNIDYVYEGVSVKVFTSISDLRKLVIQFNPDKVLIHFATFPIIKNIIFKFQLPYIIWVHGFEALAWYRRLFNFKGVFHFVRYIKGNTIQLYYFRKLIKASNDKKLNVHFVFVSDWMKRITETDCRIKVDRFSIIPNPINNDFFYPEDKTKIHQKKILMIRPFEGKKYGTDLATEAMKILERRE